MKLQQTTHKTTSHKESFGFAKAVALGNDFVLWPSAPPEPSHSLKLSRFIANRRYGIGCDQVVFFEIHEGGTAHVWFHNADGSPAEACGNGTRCLVLWMIQNGHHDQGKVTLHTTGGTITGYYRPNSDTPQHTPYVQLQYALPKDGGALTVPEIDGPCRAIDVGNPHLVCLTNRLGELSIHGPKLENHPHFAHRTNVEFATVEDNHTIRLSVWERGTGITPACGTGALATAYAAHICGLVGKKVRIIQNGGELDIHLAEDHIQLNGEAHIVFNGHRITENEYWSIHNRL